MDVGGADKADEQLQEQEQQQQEQQQQQEEEQHQQGEEEEDEVNGASRLFALRPHPCATRACRMRTLSSMR